jgi:hypothetical protein
MVIICTIMLKEKVLQTHWDKLLKIPNCYHGINIWFFVSSVTLFCDCRSLIWWIFLGMPSFLHLIAMFPTVYAQTWYNSEYLYVNFMWYITQISIAHLVAVVLNKTHSFYLSLLFAMSTVDFQSNENLYNHLVLSINSILSLPSLSLLQRIHIETNLQTWETYNF